MKVLIVDDESLARQRLFKMLDDLDGFDCVGEASNGREALAQIEALQPDITLLDIRMPDMDGMAVAEAVRDRPELQTVLVFTTAYEDHALAAFDLQAAGYLLKPVSREKLQKALEQAARLVVRQPREQGRQHLSASSRGRIELIPLEDVRLLQAEHKYVTVYYTGGEAILDESLKNLEDEFPARFKRVHRNALVSVDHVEALEKNREGQYLLRIADIDIKPAVSRRLLSHVRQWLKGL